ncbi:hypothetical protein CLOP_g12083, partial [Closterium sp. NIES-67]
LHRTQPFRPLLLLRGGHDHSWSPSSIPLHRIQPNSAPRCSPASVSVFPLVPSSAQGEQGGSRLPSLF